MPAKKSRKPTNAKKPSKATSKAPSKKPSVGGRPTDYDPKYCQQAKKLCLLGYTDAQLADFFEVAESTINLWKKEHLEFSESVKEGKKYANADVAHSLYKRAVGVTVKETTFERVDRRETLEGLADSDMLIEPYKKKIVIKELPPDQGAAMNWLKNREPELWRDKQVLDIGFGNLSDDELDAKLAAKLDALRGGEK